MTMPQGTSLALPSEAVSRAQEPIYAPMWVLLFLRVATVLVTCLVTYLVLAFAISKGIVTPQAGGKQAQTQNDKDSGED